MPSHIDNNDDDDAVTVLVAMPLLYSQIYVELTFIVQKSYIKCILIECTRVYLYLEHQGTIKKESDWLDNDNNTHYTEFIESNILAKERGSSGRRRAINRQATTLLLPLQ